MPMEIAQNNPTRAARAAIVLGQDLPFWLPFNVALTANQVGAKITVPVDNDSDFQWRACIASSTGLFSVLLTNNYIKRPLMPTPVNGENIAGIGTAPGFLAVPKRLNRTSTIQAEFTDRSGNPNTIQFCLWGYKKYSNFGDDNFIPNVLAYRKAISHVYMPTIEELAQLQGKIPYWWPLFDGTIGAQQAARSKFTAPDGCYVTHIVASSQQSAGFALQIFDTEAGQIMEDIPAVFPNHAGSAQRPFWLKKVYKLPSDGQIQCRVINLAAVANTVQVVLCGVRD